jgi:hypothetical protein
MSKPDAGDTVHELLPLPTEPAEIRQLTGVRQLAAVLAVKGEHLVHDAKAHAAHPTLTFLFCRTQGLALVVAWFLGPTCSVRKAERILYVEEDGTESESWMLAADDRPVDLSVN